ncbi:MAG TPA: N(4)-(beta-N-acetylglucosaminyl)-L-asparaginase [Vicinamibacteria bacterium]|nr:N(4)-(beta-N-acetylglucosaminyl)-L-asparaginase [Vicinamibacteria bacterium]
MSRREFVKAGAAVGAAATGVGSALAQAPAVITSRGVKPVVISSANGNVFKNGGPRTGVEEAFTRLMKGDDVLDSVIAGVNIVELDPEDDSVGYGGLPNADGVVQLDSCCMHGPKKRAGGVACIEGVRTPSLVARAVADQSDHHLIVGRGAQEFARRLGFKIEDDLNTENSRKQWLEWKRRLDPEHYLDPAKREMAATAARLSMVADGLLDPLKMYGTINMSGVNPKGEICGVTTTSGLAWKIPGRVGDSPILGAGLYVDGAIGAAGSTGRGEANLYNLSSYLIVENLRRGMAPKDAGMDALKRIRANTVEKRLLAKDGRPLFGVSFYVLNARGEHAGVSMYGVSEGKPVRYAFCNENGPQTIAVEGLLGEAPKAG